MTESDASCWHYLLSDRTVHTQSLSPVKTPVCLPGAQGTVPAFERRVGAELDTQADRPVDTLCNLCTSHRLPRGQNPSGLSFSLTAVSRFLSWGRYIRRGKNPFWTFLSADL